MEESNNFHPEHSDIFGEALKDSITNNQIITNSIVNIGTDKDKIVGIIKERLEDNETQWDLLSRMVDGGMTERFIEIMRQLPDREYAKNFLKMLEHFKPKLTRSEYNLDKGIDNTIRVEIVTANDIKEEEDNDSRG